MQAFVLEINQPDDQISLAKANLFFSQTQYPELDPDIYLNKLDAIASVLQEKLPDNSYPLKIIQTINQYLFEELRFTGNSRDYYDPRNSYLNEVLDRKLGIPISLSILYLEIAQRLSFPMVGIGMPGHFLIRPNFEDAGIFVDAFNQGEILFPEDCETRLQQVYQQSVKLDPAFLEPISNRQILVRMLTNLKIIYINNHLYDKALQVINALLILMPDSEMELRDRGLLYYQMGDGEHAIVDLETYLKLSPNAQDAPAIYQLLEQIRF
jgi:regulator of sirC expression with transglutaminase-like and TPR domain